MKYQEIKELHEYLNQYNIKHKFSKLYDGYKILFVNGEDCVQHKNLLIDKHLIEFWVREEESILRTTFEEAKKFVLERYYI